MKKQELHKLIAEICNSTDAAAIINAIDEHIDYVNEQARHINDRDMIDFACNHSYRAVFGKELNMDEGRKATLIQDLKRRIVEIQRYGGGDMESKSWGMEEGVLISGNDAVYIINQLENKST